jgi:hypothetical protein
VDNPQDHVYNQKQHHRNKRSTRNPDKNLVEPGAYSFKYAQHPPLLPTTYLQSTLPHYRAGFSQNCK